MKANVSLTDLADFAAMNEEYAHVFSEPSSPQHRGGSWASAEAWIEIELIAQA